MKVALAVTLLVFASHAMLGQTKPDFSGRWVQVTPSGEAEGGGSERVVTQDAETLTTEHPSEGGSHRQMFKLGGESRSMLGSVEVVSRTAWDGAKLVITSTAAYQGNSKRESKQIWWLDADGQLTIEFSARNPDGTTTEIKSVHQKSEFDWRQATQPNHALEPTPARGNRWKSVEAHRSRLSAGR